MGKLQWCENKNEMRNEFRSKIWGGLPFVFSPISILQGPKTTPTREREGSNSHPCSKLYIGEGQKEIFFLFFFNLSKYYTIQNKWE